MTTPTVTPQPPLTSMVLFHFDFRGGQENVDWLVKVKNQNGVEWKFERLADDPQTVYFLYVQQAYQVDQLFIGGRNVPNFALFVRATRIGRVVQVSTQARTLFVGINGVHPGDQVAPTVLAVDLNFSPVTPGVITFPTPAPFVVNVVSEAAYNAYPPR